jgi:large subunit ribosomal protein L19e
MKLQKKLAADVKGISKSRVKVNPANREQIKEAITKFDIRKLIRDKVIKILPKHGGSRARTRKIHAQKKKGRRRGLGVRKGTAGARQKRKEGWMLKIRAQRKLLKSLKESKLIDSKSYHMLYKKAKGGYFRSVAHIKLFVKENSLLKQ